MKNAVIYFGCLESEFARAQNWSAFSLGIFASDALHILQGARKAGLQVFSYTHKNDEKLDDKLNNPLNDGVFLDWATVPNEKVASLVQKLHKLSKCLAINTGWGGHARTDYSAADILLLESFIGANSGDDGKWPVTYYRRDEIADIKKLRLLKSKGYAVIALTYGQAQDSVFARHCNTTAKNNYADFFLYTQAPGWEKAGSCFKLSSFKF